MSRISITVPIELVRQGDDYKCVVKNAAGHEAACKLVPESPADLLALGIISSWADEQFTAALLKRRRSTGLKDRDGTPIFEGDILLLRHYFQTYPSMPAVVKWSSDCAAFILEGRFEDQPDRVFASDNLNGVSRHVIIGNVIEHADRFQPAARVAA